MEIGIGEQGWRSDESARLQPVWPGFDSSPVPYVGWICSWFSVVEWLRGFFFGFFRFPPSTKTKISKFQLDQYRRPDVFIYLFLLNTFSEVPFPHRIFSSRLKRKVVFYYLTLNWYFTELFGNHGCYCFGVKQSKKTQLYLFFFWWGRGRWQVMFQ